MRDRRHVADRRDGEAGGLERAQETIRRIVEHVDVLVGNEEDLQKGLGVAGPEVAAKSKLDPSAFFGTSLAATLTANGVDTLIITGLTTSGCVRATCVDSMSHGFVTLVVRDAVGDRDPRPHEANLYDMSAKYADVVPEAEAAGYLRSTALARSATEISAFEVIRAIDGPLFTTSCITIHGACDLTSTCTIKEPLRKVNDSIKDLLSGLHIADLIEADGEQGGTGAPVGGGLVSIAI